MSQDNRLRFDLVRLVRWLGGLGVAFAQGRDYLEVSLPFAKKQRLFNRKTGKLSTFHIRDHIDRSVIKQVYTAGDYDLASVPRGREILDKYDRIVASGKTPLIVDCGSNIGISTAYFAEKFPDARIVALEPEAANFSQSQLNCRGAANIDLVQAAVASESGRVNLVDPNLGSWGFRVERQADGKIPMVSINDLLADERYRQFVPLIIKIDIEGFEDDLFSKNTQWVDAFPLLIIELHDWLLQQKASSRNFLRVISTLNRDFFHRGENVFSMANTG